MILLDLYTIHWFVDFGSFLFHFRRELARPPGEEGTKTAVCTPFGELYVKLHLLWFF